MSIKLFDFSISSILRKYVFKRKRESIVLERGRLSTSPCLGRYERGRPTGLDHELVLV